MGKLFVFAWVYIIKDNVLLPLWKKIFFGFLEYPHKVVIEIGIEGGGVNRTFSTSTDSSFSLTFLTTFHNINSEPPSPRDKLNRRVSTIPQTNQNRPVHTYITWQKLRRKQNHKGIIVFFPWYHIIWHTEWKVT